MTLEKDDTTPTPVRGPSRTPRIYLRVRTRQRHIKRRNTSDPVLIAAEFTHIYLARRRGRRRLKTNLKISRRDDADDGHEHHDRVVSLFSRRYRQQRRYLFDPPAANPKAVGVSCRGAIRFSFSFRAYCRSFFYKRSRRWK